MVERINSSNAPDNGAITLQEIDRSYTEEITLSDFGEAFAVDDKFVLAYKNFWIPKFGRGHKLLVARERTVPVVPETRDRKYIDPYENEKELKGEYGMIIIPVYRPGSSYYIGEQYRIILDDYFFEGGRWNADITIESPNPIRADFISGNLDYNAYLKNLNNCPKLLD